MFGRVDFREDGKKKKKKGRENMEGKIFRRCLVGRVRGEMIVVPGCFLPRLAKKFSPQNGENLGGKM